MHKHKEETDRRLLPGTCPRCLGPLSKRTALSRRARIQVCDKCGEEEAFIDAGHAPRDDRERSYIDWLIERGKSYLMEDHRGRKVAVPIEKRPRGA